MIGVNISLEQIIAVASLLFGSGVLSFFAKNYESKRQQKRDDFVVITEALYKRIDALESDMDSIKKRNTELIDENRIKGQQIDDLREEIELLSEKNKALFEENKSLTTRKNQLSKEREGLIVQIQNLNQRVGKLEDELHKEKSIHL